MSFTYGPRFEQYAAVLHIARMVDTSITPRAWVKPVSGATLLALYELAEVLGRKAEVR